MDDTLDTDSLDSVDVSSWILDTVHGDLNSIGLTYAFRDYDATDIDAAKIALFDGIVAEPEKYGFDLPLETDEDGQVDVESFEQGLEWRSNTLRSQIAEIASQAVLGESIETVSTIGAACSDFDPTNVGLIVPATFDGYVGEIPFGVTLAIEPQGLLPEQALVVDTDRFGFRVIGEEVHVDQFREEERARDVYMLRTRQDFVVTDPTAARWVDLS